MYKDWQKQDPLCSWHSNLGQIVYWMFGSEGSSFETEMPRLAEVSAVCQLSFESWQAEKTSLITF